MLKEFFSKHTVNINGVEHNIIDVRFGPGYHPHQIVLLVLDDNSVVPAVDYFYWNEFIWIKR